MYNEVRPYVAEGFEALEEPSITSGVSACGFVFAEPFDVLLRHLTAEHLQAAWENVSTVLRRHDLPSDDFSYGWLHPGHSNVPRLNDNEAIRWGSPSAFTGWVSLALSELWREEKRYKELDEDMAQQTPLLCIGSTYRGVKWRIETDNFSSALRAMELLWTEETTEWVPENVLEYEANRNSLWGQVAVAIQQRDQMLLDRLMADARAQYSPAGYKIVLRGFASYITGSGPSLPIDMGDHLSLQMSGPTGQSSIYPDEENS